MFLELDQASNDAQYYQTLFDKGTNYGVSLFLDFEDWRFGTRGLTYTNSLPPMTKGQTSNPKARSSDGSIVGAHFNPFDQDSIGPIVPCYKKCSNEGLVLDRSSQINQIDDQEALVSDIDGRLQWLEENIEWATMDANRRSRKDVRESLIVERNVYAEWLHNEIDELKSLNSSQCVHQSCALLFNTSSLELIGVVNGSGPSLTLKSPL